jgi:hypothetical protein
MKKLLFFSLIVSSVFAFAYTQIDVDNANFLAEKGLITKQNSGDTYRLRDRITRAELVGIALKLRWTPLPENYQCKKYFSDVINNDWVCRAVEIAADEGLISRSNKYFYPQRSITKVESLSIILKASGLLEKIPEPLSYIDSNFVFVPRNINIESYLDTQWTKDPLVKTKDIILVDILDWQFSVIQKWIYLKIIDKSDFVPGDNKNFLDGKTTNPASDYSKHRIWWFREWFYADRYEAFKFLKNTYDKRELVSGEVSI